MTIYYVSVLVPILGILLSLVSRGATEKPLLFLMVCASSLLLAVKTKGHDYLGYVDYIESIQQSRNIEDVIELIKDPVFYFVVKALSIFSTSSELVFFVVGISSLGIVALSIPLGLRYKSACFGAYLFFFGPGLNYEALRAGMAVAFFLLIPKLLDTRARYIAGVLAVGSHFSLLIPVISSASNRVNRLVSRRPYWGVLCCAAISLLVPTLFLLNERLLWYLNPEETAPSVLIITIALQAILYSSLTSRLRNRDEIANFFLSSSLFTLCLSVSFAVFSEVAASRVSEIGSVAFFMLVLQDVSARLYLKLPPLKRSIAYLLIAAFALELSYSFYVRFIAGYYY
jgi:hypothetical protein